MERINRQQPVEKQSNDGWLTIIITGLIIGGFFVIFGNDSHGKDAKPSYEKSKSQTNKESIGYQSSIHVQYSGNSCAECGKRLEVGKQIYSSGDIMSYHKPYYLCNDGTNMDCINNRYRKDITMQKIEDQEREYHAASDGY